jgi:hypothetical protein
MFEFFDSVEQVGYGFSENSGLFTDHRVGEC